MMYVSQQVESFCLLSTKDTTIPEYLTSLSVSGDYLTGKFGPRDFRCIVWKGKRFGPAFGANNEKLHDYANRENIPDDDRNISVQNSVEKKFDVNNTRVNNVFGIPSFATKTASLTPCSSTTLDGIFEHSIIPVLNASVSDKERFLEIWDILVEAKSHFKLPHEIGVDPVRRLIRILKSAIKHLPKMDTQEHIKYPYWVCNYFLLTEEQAKNVKHLLDRMSTERVIPPLVAIATLIAEFQQDILELKSSRFLKDSIPVSEFARYCVLVRHSIFSAKVGSRKDLLLFWDEVWKEWLSSSDEERSKRMLGCAGVHRSWADDDEMRLFVASSEDSEEEGDVDDSFARSVTGGSQDGGLELIQESESEETFVDGIDMSSSGSKFGKCGYVDEPILSDCPLIGSTESLSKDIFENAATAVTRDIYTPPIIENTVDDLPNGFGQATSDKIGDTSKTTLVEIHSIHSDEVKHEGTKQITTEESGDSDDKIESITSTISNIPNYERPVTESTPILEEDIVEDHEAETANDVGSTEPKSDTEVVAERPFPDESKKNKDTIETGGIVESVVESEVRSEEQDYIRSLSADNFYVVSEMDTTQNYDDNFDEVNETTELGENIDETIQHSASKNSLEEHFNLNSNDTHSRVSTDSNEELQTMYNDSGDIYPGEPSPYDDLHFDADKFKEPGALTAVLDVSSTSSSACHSENEYEEVLSPAKSVESRDESIPEKIEMFEKLGGHKPMQRHLHHTLSNEEITFDKADGKNVKSILKPVTNRPDNGIVVQLKEFIENKPQLISLKSTEDFITLETERKPAMSIKKGRSISEIFAALLDDNMKDLSISAEYKNKIVRPQDLYNRIKIETDKPWDKLSRRTKERYYGAFLRKYDDTLNRPENCTVDIVDIFEIVKVCVDFDDVKHKIVRYAINIVENKEAFVPKQNSDDGESDSDSLGIKNGNERRRCDGITSHELSSARSMNRISSGKSLNSLRELRLSRDTSSSSILLPQDKIPVVNEVQVKASYDDGSTIRKKDVVS
ncbi:hypothetical protein PMKS-000223 [Pichia membranifaciens]|uniref:Uncharacterized protein n=1 Tax=Pichia membranifaciens TaxID=4926 RepID=A0A1Q2YB47_9ASCO|nr:hypothetical protein PMKS-000223 [Pichia membranifaciens]